MRRYSISFLRVITISNNNVYHIHNKTKIICKVCDNGITGQKYYREIFTNTKLTEEYIKKNNFKVENFINYIPPILRINHPGYTKKDLLYYYDDINRVELLKNIDEEDIKSYLDGRGILEESKIYKKTLNKEN